MKRSVATLIGILAIVTLAGCSSAAPSQADHAAPVVAAPAKPSASPTPAPTPTADITDVTQMAGEDAAAYLASQQVKVIYVDSTGKVVAGAEKWKVIAQDVPAGTSVSAGSTVKLTVLAPAPVVAPKPAPAKPKPVPVKPKPVPAKPKPIPAKPVAPGGGATALCNDATYSYAAHHQGACSHHGGVKVFYK